MNRGKTNDVGNGGVMTQTAPRGNSVN